MTAAERMSKTARDRAEELHAQQTPYEMKYRTTAVLVTDPSGRRYVTSSLRNGLRLSQVQRLRPNEHQAPPGTGHAETKAMAAAAADVQDPVALGVSRPICLDCRAAIEFDGGTIQWIARATW